jgi:hypothetical protein
VRRFVSKLYFSQSLRPLIQPCANEKQVCVCPVGAVPCPAHVAKFSSLITSSTHIPVGKTVQFYSRNSSNGHCILLHNLNVVYQNSIVFYNQPGLIYQSRIPRTNCLWRYLHPQSKQWSNEYTHITVKCGMCNEWRSYFVSTGRESLMFYTITHAQ